MVEKDRADRLLVALGHFESRAAARAAIEAGRVSADGQRVTKPSQILSASADIQASAAHPYVSRGGLKLAHGLQAFSLDASGRTCLDIGASTGGFTDVLLRAGAAKIIAVDVGRGQLHPRIKHDPRVISLEAQDARHLTADMVGQPAPDLLVCDASFIALEKLLERPLSLAAQNADFIGLFKPQFQVGRTNIGKGGVVSDPDAAEHAAVRVSTWLNEKGWPILKWTASPIKGGDGNAERLFHARRAR